MKIRKLYILTLSMFFTFAIKAQEEASFSEFLKLFPGSEIESEFLLKYLKYESKHLGFRLENEKVIAKKVIRRDSSYIIVEVETQCAAGGVCKKTKLYSFQLNGELISKVDYSSKVGDCGFLKSDRPIMMNDTVLVVNTKQWKGNCLDDQTDWETSTIVQYSINKGEFQKSLKREINLLRKYSEVSLRLMEDSELAKLSKEELAEMRNEIFASYGYKFKSKKWSRYFSGKGWYKQNSSQLNKLDFTLIERLNLEKIKELEK